MHWNNRNLSPLFLYFEKIGSLTLVRIFCLGKKVFVRKAMRYASPLRRQKHGYPFLWPTMLGFPTLESLMELTGLRKSQAGILHLGLLRSVSYTDITQGTGYSLVLMRPEAPPPCRAFRFSQHSLSTQDPSVLFCFFSPSVNISGT